MICCTAIAILFGAAVWVSRALTQTGKKGVCDPLNWTLEDTKSEEGALSAPNTFDWRERGQSFRYAINGVKAVVRHEHNAWIHLGAAAVAIGLGIVLQIDLSDWRWIILSITLVFAAEIVNTAIEAVCDAVTTDHHPLIGQAKDMGAGAVLICALAAVAIGVATLAPYVIDAQTPSLWDICSQ